VLWLAFAAKRFDFYTAALYSYVAFYLLSTTVHPWYLIPVVWLSLAAKKPVWLVWSFTVWFSYSHYLDPTGPKWVWLVLEYGMLSVALIVGRGRWLGLRMYND
jgi:alpha-1,6-mannosyltransferase